MGRLSGTNVEPKGRRKCFRGLCCGLKDKVFFGIYLDTSFYYQIDETWRLEKKGMS